MPLHKRLLLPLTLAALLAGACGSPDSNRPLNENNTLNNPNGGSNNSQSPDAGPPSTGNPDSGNNGGSDAADTGNTGESDAGNTGESDAGNTGESDAGAPVAQARQSALNVGASGGVRRSANFTTRLIIGGPVPAGPPVRSASYRMAPGAGPFQHGQ